MDIKAIIFDLGDVIVELDFSRFFNDIIIPSPLKKPHSFLLLEFWRQSDLYHQGKVSNEEFYQQACQLLQNDELDQESFFHSFNSVIADINQDIITIIKKIRYMKKYKMILLSNINASHWDYLLNRKWEFIEYFDELILSHEVKMTKPDPRIFKYTIEKAGVKPEQILYIDDGINNVKAAGELGIQAIKFTNVEDLIKELKERKILLV